MLVAMQVTKGVGQSVSKIIDANAEHCQSPCRHTHTVNFSEVQIDKLANGPS